MMVNFAVFMLPLVAGLFFGYLLRERKSTSPKYVSNHFDLTVMKTSIEPDNGFGA
jgi:hypothetical protein